MIADHREQSQCLLSENGGTSDNLEEAVECCRQRVWLKWESGLKETSRKWTEMVQEKNRRTLEPGLEYDVCRE